MEKIYIMILLIIVFTVLYLLVKNQNIEQYREDFTAIVGTSNPLVTYDDYGTFNFIHHFDDLPYYDPTYNIMSDYTKNRLDSTQKNIDKKLESEDFDSDSFFELCGYKIRKELIPSNYAETKNAHFTKYATHVNLPEHPKFKKVIDTQLATSHTVDDRSAPQPYNYYFNN